MSQCLYGHRKHWIDLHMLPGALVREGLCWQQKAPSEGLLQMKSFEMATSRAWLESGLRMGNSFALFSLFLPESPGHYIQPSAWSWPPAALWLPCQSTGEGRQQEVWIWCLQQARTL